MTRVTGMVGRLVETQLEDANLYAIAKGFADSVTKGERKVKYEEDNSSTDSNKTPF